MEILRKGLGQDQKDTSFRPALPHLIKIKAKQILFVFL